METLLSLACACACACAYYREGSGRQTPDPALPHLCYLFLRALVIKGAGTPFFLIFVQFFSQKITSIVLSPHNHGYSTLTGIYLPTLGLI